MNNKYSDDQLILAAKTCIDPNANCMTCPFIGELYADDLKLALAERLEEYICRFGSI